MCERGKPGRRERMQNSDEKHARRERVERLELYTCGELRGQRLVRYTLRSRVVQNTRRCTHPFVANFVSP
jgi:hypothetical protein